MSRLDWAPILNLATDIVRFYNTSVTLGQLGSEQLLPNTDTSCTTLSVEDRRIGSRWRVPRCNFAVAGQCNARVCEAARQRPSKPPQVRCPC